jgi:hypothetical protein
MIKDIINYKLILFDFDDTLCIHSKHSGISSDVVYNNNVICKPIQVVYPLEECEPNAHMKEFTDYANSCGTKTFGLLSATIGFPHMQRKIEWVTLNYGYKLENFSVGKRKEKIDMIKGIAAAMLINYDQVLFIDDNGKSIEAASECGFDACTPMEIVNFVENHLRS